MRAISDDVDEAFELDRSRLVAASTADGDEEGEPNCCRRAAVFFGTVRMLGVELDEVGVVAGTRIGSTLGDARGDEAESFPELLRRWLLLGG